MLRRTHGGTKLRVEGLENRLMLNGDVTSALVGGVLTLTGPNGANQDHGLLITSTGNAGEFTVRGFGDTAADQAEYLAATGENLGDVSAGLTAATTVDGAASQLFTGVTGIKVELRKGSDLAIIGDGVEDIIVDELDVNMGSGTDTPDRLLMTDVGVQAAPGLAVTFDGAGTAVNKAWIAKTGSLDNIQINGSDTQDEFYLGDVMAKKVFKLLADRGEDLVRADGMSARRMVVKGQGQPDDIELKNLDVANKLKVLGNAGKDLVQVSAAAVGGDALIRGDGGKDSITVRNVEVGGQTAVNLGGTAHDDILLFQQVFTRDDVAINAGNGTDQVTIRNCEIGGPTDPNVAQNNWDDLAITMGAGADDLLLFEQVTAWSVAVDGGAGAGDTLDTTGTTVYSWIDVWADANFENRNIDPGDVLVGTPGAWLV